MGCDIDFFVERKIKDFYGEMWISCDTWVQSPWCSCKDRHSYELVVPYDKQFYEGRDYKLYAKLADVRNRDNIKPIAKPRGLPEDIGELVNIASMKSQGHSASWFTLKELLKEDWSDPDYEMFRETLEEMKKLGEPDNVRAVFWFNN